MPATHTPAVRGRPRARASSPSASCRPPRDRRRRTPCWGPARRRWTRAPGSWTTAWSRMRSAGSGRATPGFTIAASSSRWSRSAGSWKGISLDAEAGAQAADIDDLFERLEASGRLVRIDPSRAGRRCIAARCSAPASCAPCGRSRTWSGSVACGASRPTGSSSSGARSRPAPTSCTWIARRSASATRRPCRSSSPAGSCSSRYGSSRRRSTRPSLGFVEAHRDDDADKNRLCPPNPYPRGIEDWPRMVTRTWTTEQRWLSEPDVSSWIAQSRLNLLRALPEHAGRAVGPDRAGAIPHPRRRRDRAAPAARRIRRAGGGRDG